MKKIKILLLISLIIPFLNFQKIEKISAVTGGVGFTIEQTFPDANMAKWIGIKLNKSITSTITQADVDNMTNLNLDNMQIADVTGVGIFTNLQVLYVINNLVTTLPPEIGDLKKLTYLNLKNNRITLLPDSIGTLPLLGTLELTNNRLTEFPSFITSIQSLGVLYLDKNSIAVVPEDIGVLKNLGTLHLGNNIIKKLPDSITELTNLTYLNTNVNQLTELPANIGNLANLQTFYSQANFIKTLPESTRLFTRLNIFNLNGNQIVDLNASLYNDLRNTKLTITSQTGTFLYPDERINADLALEQPIFTQSDGYIDDTAFKYDLTRPDAVTITVTPVLVNGKYTIPASYLQQSGVYKLRVSAYVPNANTVLTSSAYNITFKLIKSTPVLTLTNPNPINILQGGTYVEPGYNATDSIDGDLTSSVVITNNLDTSILGLQSINYTVTNSFNESATATRLVYIIPVDTGLINVEYVDTLGNLLRNQVLTGKVGDPYTTTAVSIPNYTLNGIPANANGLFINGVQKVTYVYTDTSIINGDVNVKYIDEFDGSLLFSTTLSGQVGNPYVTRAILFSGYSLVSTPANQTGLYTMAAQEVVYTYSKLATPVIKTGTVNVVYQDDLGNILTSFTMSGVELTAYTTNFLTIPGYTLTSTPANATGTYNDGVQTVTYVYTKDGLPATLTIKHINALTNELLDFSTKVGIVGDTYTTTPISFLGYTLVSTPANATGIYTTDPQEIIYTYSKDVVKTGTITVNYVNEITLGIIKTETLSGVVGDSYTTIIYDFTGYSLHTLPANAGGFFIDGNINVNYGYIKDVLEVGKVEANYVDTSGNLLAHEILTGVVGDSYNTKILTIAGYTLKTIPVNKDGEYGTVMFTVTFVYDKNANSLTQGTVVVKHIDTDTNAILNFEVKEGLVGDPYTTNAETFFNYTLEQTPSNAEGTIQNVRNEVVYRYKYNGVVNPNIGTVIVKYINETDNTLLNYKNLSGNIGDAYTTDTLVFPGYTLKEVATNAQGTFSAGSKEVIYTYIKDTNTIVNKGIVIVKHVQLETNTLLDFTNLEGNVGESYTTQEKVFPGYTLRETPLNKYGIFGANIQEVTYYYAKDLPPVGDTKNNVIVEYRVENSDISLKTIILKGAIDEPYTSTALAFTGYTLVSTPANATGKFTEDLQEVIYTYHKDTTSTIGNVVVEYMIKDTEMSLKTDVLSGSVGKTADVSPLVFAGYTYDSSNARSLVTYQDSIQIITFYYVKNPVKVETGIINVIYFDKTNNVNIVVVKLSGVMGDTYSTNPIEIDGYTLEGIPQNANGSISNNEEFVIYNYTKNNSESPNITTPAVKPTKPINNVVSKLANTGLELNFEMELFLLISLLSLSGITFLSLKRK